MRHDKNLSLEIKAQLLHLLCKSLKRLMPSAVLIPLPLFPLLWDHANHTTLFLWFIVSLAVDFSRYYLSKQYLAENKTPVTSARAFKQWTNKLTFAYFLGGLRWSYVAAVFFYPTEPIIQSLIFAIIFVIFTGLIYTSSMLPQTFYAYSIPIVITITAQIYFHIDSITGFLSFCFTMIVYYTVSIEILKISRNSTIDSIKLRFKNIDLIDKLEQEKKVAEKATRRMSYFLATASHDLRQPAQSLELLVDTLGSHANEEVTINKIKASTNTLSSLLDNLLDMSKLDAKVMRYKKLSVSIPALFSQMQNDFEERAKQKQIELIIKPININIHTDPTLFFRILSNLLDNAIKYTEAGSISLTAKASEGKVCVQVTDTGIGIPKEKQSLVFEEFQQLQNSGRDRSKGLGLGLSICLRMSELLDHQISLHSEGQGTQIELCLDEAMDKPTEAKQSDEKLELNGRIILIIENEEDIRYALRVSLELCGASIYEASSRQKAQLILNHLKRPVDLIICDYRLDDDDGVSIITEIRKNSAVNIPAIILTGDVVHNEIEKLEYTQILIKPVSTNTLKSIIQISIQNDESDI